MFESAASVTNSLVFISLFISFFLNIGLNMLWGSINALQIIVCLSYSSVPWNAVLGFVFDWLTQITSFDLLNPFGSIPLTDGK